MSAAAAMTRFATFLLAASLAAGVHLEPAPRRPAADTATAQLLMRKEQRRPESIAPESTPQASVLEDARADPVPNIVERTDTAAMGGLHHHFLPFLNEDAAAPTGYVTCFKGGKSGPSFQEAQVFDEAALPPPPMTLTARVRTTTTGRFQVIMGWGLKHGHWDAAELRLGSTGNLQYGVHDGLAWNFVEAKPAVHLQDGKSHWIAMVRDVQGGVQLYVNGSLVGHGYIPGNPRTQLTSARSARLMYGYNDLAFDGKVSQVFVYNRDLSYWEVNKLPRVPCRRENPLTLIDIGKATLVNNLGGMGPDSGERAIRLGSVAEFGGVPLDLVITNLTQYQPMNVSANGKWGKDNKLVHINLLANTSVTLRFEFMVRGTKEPLRLDDFVMSFMDIDRAPNNKSIESVTINTDVAAFWVTEDTHLEYTRPTQNTSLSFIASPRALGNWRRQTRDPDDPTDRQERRSFALVLTNTSGFEATLSATEASTNASGRTFTIAGWSAIVQDGMNKTANQSPQPDVAIKPPQ